MFLFYLEFMLVWAMRVEFNDTGTVLGKWNVSRVIPRLYGWVHKILRPTPLVVENSAEVVTARSRLRRSQINGQLIFDSRFIKLVLRISGYIKFWDPAEDSNNSDPSSITFRMKYLFAFQFWCCKLCLENQWGGGRSIVLLIFVLWQCFIIVGGWEVVGWGRKSYLGPAKIASFQAGISVEAIRMTHSDTLYRLDNSTFYFYKPLLFQIFAPWKFIKT